MEEIKLIDETKRLLLLRYSNFGGRLAHSKIEYKNDLKYHTAATDGKTIYIDPDYFSSLNDDERMFLIAHELLHMEFDHVFRLLDKNGNKRDMDAWNEATDAIINANLERDGFKIKEGYVNRPEALDYSAEEFYEIVLKENQNKKSNSNNDGTSGNTSENNYSDDHSLWEEAFEKKQSDNLDNDLSDGEESNQFNEAKWFSQNREERKIKIKEKLEEMRNQLFEKKNESSEVINLGNVGNPNESVDWKVLLRYEVEKSETIWSQRRSIAENNYAYRLEENEIDDDAETEVMIDVSGSVSLELVKSFLRILKSLLPHSKLKVGCFNEKFWGMVEIKTPKDIDNFVIPSGARGPSAWTEDWDLAVRSFTKRNEINKFVFTDGIPGPGVMPKEDLKNENVIWLVYGNENFHPCCGKVINITEKQLNDMYILNGNESDFKKTR